MFIKYSEDFKNGHFGCIKLMLTPRVNKLPKSKTNQKKNSTENSFTCSEIVRY